MLYVVCCIQVSVCQGFFVQLFLGKISHEDDNARALAASGEALLQLLDEGVILFHSNLIVPSLFHG